MRYLLFLLTAAVTIAASYGGYVRLTAGDIKKDSLIECEGKTISMSGNDGVIMHTLVYSVSPADGSAQFRYMDANGHASAIRQIRLGQTSVKASRERILLSGVVTDFSGSGDLPKDDPFLIQIHKGSSILFDMNLFKDRVWNVGIGSLDLGYCIMYK
ncbi:hypothetical protein [Burkholderia vietnamiensis]|uniref:hypothetical protein n=3 Tax=Burkholderia vietnamiensis TaxID=60552 RepID=UPI000ADCD3F3|nr:hypothetical protein [Burkholderia vietnamiensis]